MKIPKTDGDVIAALTADVARLTAALERKTRECEGLREALRDSLHMLEVGGRREAMTKLQAALSAGEK